MTMIQTPQLRLIVKLCIFSQLQFFNYDFNPRFWPINLDRTCHHYLLVIFVSQAVQSVVNAFLDVVRVRLLGGPLPPF
ncbi:hypothetical protein [Lactobacillus phage LL-H]|uniref:hypothetical protein n=1 Tax=Lactococcus phage LL-H TaxID=12348 RepID=UPI0000F6E47E|nr:hypothetical protein LPLLH_ORF77 [Lactobacillus phage LL-H]ABO60923.1 hypothetical protein [Lactobacillus phage LL-H]